MLETGVQAQLVQTYKGAVGRLGLQLAGEKAQFTQLLHEAGGAVFKGVQGACSAEDRVQGRVVESNGRHEGAYLGKDKRLLEHLEVGSLA